METFLDVKDELMIVLIKHYYFDLTVFILKIKIHMFFIMEIEITYFALDPDTGKTIFEVISYPLIDFAYCIDPGIYTIYRSHKVYCRFQQVIIICVLPVSSSFTSISTILSLSLLEKVNLDIRIVDILVKELDTGYLRPLR